MANPDIIITPGDGTIGFSGSQAGDSNSSKLLVGSNGDLHMRGSDMFISGNLTVSGDITSASASHEATSYTATTHVSGLSGYFGKVGIGSSSIDPLTDSTSTRLQISHPDESFAVNLKAAGTSYIPNLALSSDRPSASQEMGKIKWLNNGATPVAQIKAIRGSSDTVGHLNFQTCNAHAMQIWSDQKVQIASTQNVAPQATLVISGDASITGELRTNGKMGIGGADAANTDGLHIIGADLSNDDDLIVLGGNFSSATILGSIGTHHTDVNNGGLKFSSKTAGTLTEYMRIDKDGKVGIGTTNPSHLLHLRADNPYIDFTDDGDNGQGGLLFRDTSNNNQGSVVFDFANNVLKFSAHSWSNDAHMALYRSTGPKLQISPDQNVAPQAMLVVSGDASITGQFRTDGNATIGGGVAPLSNVALILNQASSDFILGLYRAGTAEWFQKVYTDGRFALHENGVGDLFTIKAGGNVGIGTTNPAELLTVSGVNPTVRINNPNIAGSDTAAYTFGFDANVDIAGMRIDHSDRIASGLALFVHPAYGYPISVTPSPTKDILLNVMDGGGVGIGTTNPNNTLHVHTASAGSVTADTDRDDLVIENSTNVGLTFLSPNTDKAAIAFGDPQNSRMGLITYDHAHDSLAIRVNNTDNLLTVQSGGEVGVGGTGQHGALFTVHGDTSVTGELSTDNLYAGGIAGIGITPSSHRLEVAGGSYNSNLKLKGGGAAVGIQFADSDNNTDGYIYAAGTNIGFLDAGTDWMVRCVNDQFIYFATNGNTQHMRVNSDGKVLIGEGQSPTALLTVSGDASITGELKTDGNVGINADPATHSDTAARNLVIKQDSGGGGITINTATNAGGNIYFADGTSSSSLYRGYLTYNHTIDTMIIGAAAATQFAIDATATQITGDLRVKQTARLGYGGVGQSDSLGGGSNVMAHLGDGNFVVRQGLGGGYIAFDAYFGEWNQLLSLSRHDGAVGIGITGGFAGSKLAVNGDASITGDLRTNGNIGVGVAPAHKLSLLDTAVGAFINPRNSQTRVDMGTYTDHDLALYAGENERVRIDKDGNVGIGETSPEGLLSFKADESNTPKIRFQNQHSVTADAAVSTFDDANGTTILIGSNLYIASDGTTNRFNTSEQSAGFRADRGGLLQFYAGEDGATATERIRVTADGKVGIATTNPSEELHVSGNAIFSNGGASTNTHVRIGQGLGTNVSFGGGKYTAEGTNKNFLFLGASNGQGGIRLTSLDSSSYEIWADSTALHFDSLNGNRDFYFNSNQTDENIVYITQGEGAVGIGVKPSALAGSRLAVSGDTSITGKLSVDDRIACNGPIIATSTVDCTSLGVTTAIIHDGDSDTKITFDTDIIDIYAGNLRMLTIEESSDGADAVVINENSADINFRVESNGEGNMLLVDGGTDRVGIATSAPHATFHVNDEASVSGQLRALNIGIGVAVADASNTKLQIKTDTDDHLLFRPVSTLFGSVGLFAGGGAGMQTLNDAYGATQNFGIQAAKIALAVDGNYAGLMVDSLGKTQISPTQNVAPQAMLVVSGTASITGELRTNGAVGINGAAPDSILQINNADSSSYRFGYGGTSDVYLDADNIYFRSDGGGNPQIVIKEGSLGIGATDPKALLDVNGDASITGELKVSIGGVGILAHGGGGGVAGGFTSYPGGGINAYALGMYRSVTTNSSPDIYDQQSDSVIIGAISNQPTLLVHKGDGTLAGGRVGIGDFRAADPQAKLVVSGEASISGELRVDGNLLFADAANDNVGIGTTVPAGKLDIIGSNGTVAGAPDTDTEELVIRNNDRCGIQLLSAESSGKTSQIIFGSASDINAANVKWNYHDKLFSISTQNADGEMALKTANGAEAVRIDTNGNVGIGTSNPAAKLHITSNGSHDEGAEIVLRHDNNNTTDVVSTLSFQNNAGQVAKIAGETVGANNNGVITFHTDDAGSSTEAMRIDSSQRVGIATTNPDSLLTVSGDAQISGQLRVGAHGEGGIRIGSWQNSSNQSYGAIMHEEVTPADADHYGLLLGPASAQDTYLNAADGRTLFLRVDNSSEYDSEITASGVLWNRGGLANADFAVKGDSNVVFKVDAGDEYVDLQTAKLKIGGTGNAGKYLKSIHSTNGSVSYEPVNWEDLPTIASLTEI